MHELARKPKAPRQETPGKTAAPDAALFGQRVSSILQIQRTLGNRAVAQRQPAPAPPRQPQPLDYDRDVQRGRVDLDPRITRADLVGQLNKQIQAGHLTSYQVKGARAGSPAELFLLALIFGAAKKARWGTESDLVTVIGWPAKPGAPAPLGQVTLRFDRQGAATAELIAAGPVAAPPQASFADGISRLTSDFGFSSVTGWADNANGAAEISDVLGALDLLKRRAPQDVAALKGLALIRVASLGGNTAGEYSMTGRWLKLANGAFNANAFQFFGGGPASPSVPASYQTILHEVGHAVEMEVLRVALEARDKARADVEAVKQRIQDDVSTFDKDFEQAKKDKKVSQFYKKRENELKKNEKAQAEANDRYLAEADKVKATKVDAAVVQPLESKATAESASAASALAAAKSQSLLPAEAQGSSAYTRAVEETAAAIAAFPAAAQTGASLEDLENAVLRKVADRNRARDQLKARSATHKALALLDRAAQAQDRWFEAERLLVRGRGRTRRLQKFIQLVRDNNIRRFTKYSADNWLLKPGELYAEAYSLWLVDPDFLKTNYRVVYDFFQAGDYRN